MSCKNGLDFRVQNKREVGDLFTSKCIWIRAWMRTQSLDIIFDAIS